MNRIIFAIFGAVFVLAVISLATFLGVDTGPSTAFKARPNEETVLFAVTPWGDPIKVKESYKPLITYLSERTGRKFQYLGMEDYEVAGDNIVEGNVDISVLVPISYIKAKEREPKLKYIATALMGEGEDIYPTYKGVIITLKSKYAGMKLDDFLSDPKKYTIGYVARSSASGWAYPAAMLKGKGIHPINAFKEAVFMQNHPGIFEELVSGRIDIGASWDGSLHEAVERYGDIFNVIYTTGEIPNDVWVASANVEPAFVEKIRDIMWEINSSEELKERLLLREAHDKGWVSVDESFFKGLKEVVDYVAEYN